MKLFCYLTFVLLSFNTVAQQTNLSSSVTNTEIKQSDATANSVTKIDINNRGTQGTKPILVTAEDKKLWTRPVTQNPNYNKVMQLKDPNEVVPEDKE